MDAITERVGKSSGRRLRPKQYQTSLAESPPSQRPRNSQKSRKRKSDSSSGQYYSVKEILHEKIENGQLIYLIDWEDNSQTGESYKPTWEPYDNVNRGAIEDWIKRKGPTRTEESRRSVENIARPTSASDLDSQSIRTTKRRITNRSPNSSLSPSQPPRKKPRRAGTAETARFQSVSGETIDSQGKPKEIKDSYEEQSLSSRSGRVRVEIPVDEGFDQDAYSKVTVVSSQISQNTQTSHSSQLSQLLDTPYQPEFDFSTRREDDEGKGVDRDPIIPDSQFLPGSSSYVPPTTQRSYSGVATQPNTGTESDLATASSSESIFVSPAVVDSTGSSKQHSETPSRRPRTSNSDDSELASSQANGRRRIASSAPQRPSTFADSSQSSYSLQASSNLESLRDSISSSERQSRQVTSNSAVSTDFPTASESRLRSSSSRSWSQEREATHGLSQEQSHQPPYSVSDEPSLQLQTQVPLATQDEVSSQTFSHLARPRSLEEISSPQLDRSEKTPSQTSGLESLVEQELTPSQRSASSSAAIFQASNVHVKSAAPQVHNQQNQLSLEQDQRSLLRHRRNEASQTSTPNIDFDSKKTLSKSLNCLSPEVESVSKVNKRDLPFEQASENVLPSIELTADIVSSPPSKASPSFSLTAVPQLYEPSSTLSRRSSAMADQAVDQITTAERLRRARITAAETKMEEQRIARTASAIPHTPPPPPVNPMLPLRETAPETRVAAEPAPSPDTSPESEESEAVKGLQLLPLGENVFTVPLPMVSLARDIYDQEITNHRPQRRSFLNDTDIDTTVVEDIDQMLERLKMICDHQDLIDADSPSQVMEPDHRQAKWAENISTKCIYLAELFNSLQSVDTHIVLLVRPGRMMDILEAVFRLHHYSYVRPDRPSNQIGQGLMKISLLPTNVDSRKFGVGPAALVIAFDSTFVYEPHVESLRTDLVNTQRLAPLIYLVITHSIEHLELCIKKNMYQIYRKAILVNSLSYTRQDVGKLDPDYPSPDAAAKALADFIIEGARGDGPFLPMPVIEGIEVPDTVAEDSNRAQLSGSTTQSYNASSSNILQPAFKRPLSDEDDSESSKRLRLTPVSGVPSSGINVARIDEPSSAITSNANAEVTETQEVVAKADDLDGAQKDRVASLLKQMNELEIQLRTKEGTETALRQSNQRLQARCTDYESSIEKIVPKYQEALNERGQAAHDIQEAMAREITMRQKLDARTSELAKVQEEKALVDTELAAARTALSSSFIPEVAELQILKDELRTANLDMEKTQKKLASAHNDMEYMRNNYQKASSAAAEIRNELDELKAQNEILARKASGNAVEIHRIQHSMDIREYLQLISELETEKAETERELEKKSEELKTLLNGRRPTRGTSVPRSPRMGTMSPGQSSRPMARVFGGVGSRGNSPAPGGGESGFRGPGTFGDALYPSGVANRWGNHLS